MTAVIHKISVGAGGKHTLSPEESREAIKPGTERNGTEPEVIDAQYGLGRRMREC